MAESRDFSVVVSDEFYGRVPADTDDIVFRYRDPTYNHLRYHVPVKVRQPDGQERQFTLMKALFLGAMALDTLAVAGIPETYVDVPSTTILNAFESDTVARMEAELGE